MASKGQVASHRTFFPLPLLRTSNGPGNSTGATANRLAGACIDGADNISFFKDLIAQLYDRIWQPHTELAKLFLHETSASINYILGYQKQRHVSPGIY